MTYRKVTTGDDPLTKPILDYLREKYDMPETVIHSVKLESTSGKLQMITVELYVPVDDLPKDASSTVVLPIVPTA